MSTGIAKVLADVLRNDILSIPASTFLTPAYSSIFNNQASAVPTSWYTCLRDIWLQNSPHSGQLSSWPTIVNDSYGLGTSNSISIDVIPIRILDQVDGPKDEGPKSNQTGAEFAEIHIILKIPEGLVAADSNRIFEAESRIRRLLDFNYAPHIGTKYITSTDINIRTDRPIVAYWQGLSNPIDSKLVHIVFYTYYTRLFF